MHTSSLYTPKRLVEVNRRFRIPLYQRPFAWEEPQIAQLLKDLYSAFENSSESEYHIGILSIAPGDLWYGDDIIDGQQRITTLLLIGKACMECAPSNSSWTTLLRQKRLNLYGRTEDQRFLDEGDDSQCNPRMKNAVEVARRFLIELGENSGEQARFTFSEYIYSHAAFFLSPVPNGYTVEDKNRQFVRMNNRGKQLEKHEILKVKLLSRVTDGDLKIEFAENWNKMGRIVAGCGSANTFEECKPLEKILDTPPRENLNNEEELLRSAIVTIPEFLLIALSRTLADQVSPDLGKLILTFEDKLLSSNFEELIHRFFSVLNEQSLLLNKYFIFQAKNGTWEIGGSDVDEDWIAKSSKGNSERLIALQSFLHISTEPLAWLVPAFDYLSNLDTPVELESFVSRLEKIDNMLITEKIRKISELGPLKDMCYPRISHYWFYRLDYELWKLWEMKSCDSERVWSCLRSSSKTETDLADSFRFRRCGSIEHIYPQNGIGPDIQGMTVDHSFGNLALISASRNSQFSNFPADSKKAIIRESGYTESLKMLHFLWCRNGSSEEHAQLMYKILHKAVCVPLLDDIETFKDSGPEL